MKKAFIKEVIIDSYETAVDIYKMLGMIFLVFLIFFTAPLAVYFFNIFFESWVMFVLSIIFVFFVTVPLAFIAIGFFWKIID